MAAEVMTLQEVMAFLRVSRFAVYRYLGAGKLRGFRIPAGWRFYRSDVEAFLRGEQANAN